MGSALQPCLASQPHGFWDEYLVNGEPAAAWYEKDPRTGREKCHIYNKKARGICVYVYLANGLPVCYDIEGREIPFYARPTAPPQDQDDPLVASFVELRTPGRPDSAEPGL